MTTATVFLDTPIKRGDTKITKIDLRKPDSGALRGTTLNALMNFDVDALFKVLPRISTPALTEQELHRMDPADLIQLGSEFAVFLAPKSAIAKLQASGSL